MVGNNGGSADLISLDQEIDRVGFARVAHPDLPLPIPGYILGNHRGGCDGGGADSFFFLGCRGFRIGGCGWQGGNHYFFLLSLEKGKTASHRDDCQAADANDCKIDGLSHGVPPNVYTSLLYVKRQKIQ